MKFSKLWLQEYIVETLPKDGVIADVLNKKAFEVEEVVFLKDDVVYDIKVLPNRAHDALGHKGMAYELCAILGLTRKLEKYQDDTTLDTERTDSQKTDIDDAKACLRFMTVRIDGVKVGDSPAWLKDRLEAIGQRSINNVVDITNYVQFALNKPMHAYDTRSIKGTIRARSAKKGESLTTLDEKELSLDEKTLVIADDEKVLGLAGIKGGKYSGIQSDTTSIVLESANFAPVLTRKTSQKYGFHTDASKRFENGIANSLIEEGLLMTMKMIVDMCGDKGTKVSDVVDVYPKKDTPYYVGISLSELNTILGTSYNNSDVENTMKALAFSYEKIVPEDYMQSVYKNLIGVAYKNPSSMREDAPNAFSCSSLVSYLYKGIWMPSISIDKYVFAKKVELKNLRFGDLVFANSGEGKIYYESIEFLRGTKVNEGIDHVGMFLGDGTVIHATKVQGKVVIETLTEFMKTRTIVGYGRIVENLHEERYVVDVPKERLDIRIKEDLAEELGRVLGYDNLKPFVPKLSRIGLPHKRMYYENKIREILNTRGYSEVMTYTFGDKGEVGLVKGLADDKEKLRTNIGGGLLQSLSLNLYNAPLLGQKTVRIFEFGNVFTKDAETRHLALALDDGGKKSNFTEEVDMILAEIKRTLKIKEIECQTVSSKPYCIEIDFDTLLGSLPEPTSSAGGPTLYETPTFATLPVVSYKTVSPYPFIARDIAMWVPDSVTWESISHYCAEIRNPLVARVDLFDTFSKEIEGVKKTSYAFRLVFQSYEKTLTDEEVNGMMEEYYKVFKDRGFEIR